ncbi:cysteine hydrolase family protein [Breoghania sp. JC706]|uniref:cysteine hydrolase family protein n=1 Tax=Breoghania sp. JC706 TaxID=3117732 RepID=UPI003008455F
MTSSLHAIPKTLRDMAGAGGWQRPAPGEAAVVLIDAQEEYRSGALQLDDVTLALEEIARLRQHARDLDLPVVHVRHVGAPGGLFDLDARGGAFCVEAEPLAGETVIDKRLPNSFAGTNLAETLADKGIRRIVVAGFMTHMCVSSTVRAALDLGLESAVVASACATRALPTHDGSVVSAGDVHRAALAALGDRFAHILPGAAAV